MELLYGINNQIEQLQNFLEEKDFAQSTIHYYQGCWKQLILFANEQRINEYTIALGKQFLLDFYSTEPKYELIKKFNRAVKLLETYVMKGEIPGPIKRASSISASFNNVYQNYVQSLISKGQSAKSIKTKKSRVRKFLQYLESEGILTLSSLEKKEIISFMLYLKNVYSSSGRGNILYTLRDFLSYCAIIGETSSNLSTIIKCIYTNSRETIPSVYSQEEMKNLLSSINRDTTKGKKDYAIVTLLTVFGLRSGDVIQLKLDDIKWKKKCIEFYQHKTGVFAQLPMPDQVQLVLMDYLKNSRPNSEFLNVFLRSRAPCVPYSDTGYISRIVSGYFYTSGIKINGRNHGPHSLRHSMASALLENETTLPVIAKALGHTNTKNTSHYLRIDIKRLRTVALEVPL